MSLSHGHNEQPRWHLIYYLLAGADLVTIGVSLWLAHSILGIFHQSSIENRQWVERLNEYEELAEIAGDVNAPGNDVFDDKDYDGQSERMDASLGLFNEHLQVVREEIDSKVVQLKYKDALNAQLISIEKNMAAMVAEALTIFGQFRIGNENAAGARMASMDRAYAQLNDSLRVLRTFVIHTQDELINQETLKATTLARYELYISLVVVFIVFCAAGYGHSMQRKLKATAALIEHQNHQLMHQGKLAALGTMAGGIAHEINNPLTVIKGFGGQLERMIKRGKLDEESVAKASKMIVKTSDRIAAIVRGLRVFSRDGSRDPFKSESVTELIEDAKLFCAERMMNRRVQLKVEAPAENFRFDCRMVEIGQVIINLLNNAADAVGGKSNAWVLLKISKNDINGMVRISVKDSGEPIPEHIAKNLFTPFFTTKAVGEGTGLGLAICMGIAKGHHGTLSLDRSQGCNEFILEIPAVQSEAEKQEIKDEGVAA
jgi:C4-dicarboxylate-specific signal transduction histidine kinase